jgi:UrcA family protein
MKTNTRMLQCSRPRAAPRMAGLIALLAVAPVPVMADTLPAPPPETRTMKISLADLDLSTPEGAHAARERLHETARRLCSRVEGIDDLWHQPHFVACVDDALADALRQVQALRQVRGPAVASVPVSPASAN